MGTEGSRTVALGLASKVLAGPFSTGHPIHFKMTEGSSRSSEHPKKGGLQERNMAEMKTPRPQICNTCHQIFPLKSLSFLPQKEQKWGKGMRKGEEERNEGREGNKEGEKEGERKDASLQFYSGVKSVVTKWLLHTDRNLRFSPSFREQDSQVGASPRSLPRRACG